MRTDVYTCLCLHQAILLSCLNYFPDFYEINQTDNCPCRIRNLIGPTNNKFRNFFLDKSLRPSRYLVPVLSLGTINPITNTLTSKNFVFLSSHDDQINVSAKTPRSRSKHFTLTKTHYVKSFGLTPSSTDP